MFKIHTGNQALHNKQTLLWYLDHLGQKCIYSPAEGLAVLHHFLGGDIAFYTTAKPLLILLFIRLDLSLISLAQMRPSVGCFFFF